MPRAQRFLRVQHTETGLCVLRAHPLVPPGRVQHTPLCCVSARATHTGIERVLPGLGFDQGPTNQARSYSEFLFWNTLSDF